GFRSAGRPPSAQHRQPLRATEHLQKMIALELLARAIGTAPACGAARSPLQLKLSCKPRIMAAGPRTLLCTVQRSNRPWVTLLMSKLKKRPARTSAPALLAVGRRLDPMLAKLAQGYERARALWPAPTASMPVVSRTELLGLTLRFIARQPVTLLQLAGEL